METGSQESETENIHHHHHKQNEEQEDMKKERRQQHLLWSQFLLWQLQLQKQNSLQVRQGRFNLANLPFQTGLLKALFKGLPVALLPLLLCCFFALWLVCLSYKWLYCWRLWVLRAVLEDKRKEGKVVLQVRPERVFFFYKRWCNCVYCGANSFWAKKKKKLQSRRRMKGKETNCHESSLFQSLTFSDNSTWEEDKLLRCWSHLGYGITFANGFPFCMLLIIPLLASWEQSLPLIFQSHFLRDFEALFFAQVCFLTLSSLS